MATRTFAHLAAAVLPACVLSVNLASAQIFQLEGEITDGAFFVPNPGGGPDIVFDDFPVAYTGVFTYQATSSLATFEFTPESGGPKPIPENLFPGVLQNDEAALLVDYLTSLVQAIMTSFELTLDKQSGQGQWEWHDLCLLCDRIIDPFAQATITSYRIVPGVPGDFNENGVADAADYVVWRNGLGTTHSPVHYDLWQANFGRTTAGGNTAGFAVPEAASWLLALTALAALTICRR